LCRVDGRGRRRRRGLLTPAARTEHRSHRHPCAHDTHRSNRRTDELACYPPRNPRAERPPRLAADNGVAGGRHARKPCSRAGPTHLPNFRPSCWIGARRPRDPLAHDGDPGTARRRCRDREGAVTRPGCVRVMQRRVTAP
jgi:hypothetical protein